MAFTGKKELLMSAAILILAALLLASNGKMGARLIISCAKEYIRKRKKLRSGTAFRDQSFRNALSRLRADGLVEREGWGIWKITVKGKEHIRAFMGHAARYEKYADHLAKKEGKSDTVVIFDVPESRAPQRARLRFELFALGFTMVQKSVWMGSGPLPISFMRYLRDAELLPHVRIFSIKGKGTLIMK